MTSERLSSRPGEYRVPAPPGAGPRPRVVARAAGAAGGEVVLRRAGDAWEIISNGVFLMDTRDGRSEREMVRAALAALPAGRADVHVLVGGLGMGFSTREALASPVVTRVLVVELEPTIVEWHGSHLAPLTGRLLDDPRVEVECADLVPWLARAAHQGAPRFDVVCLDVDNGPEWTVTEGNARLYRDTSLGLLASIIRPGGVLTLWSAAPAPGFADLLARRFGAVQTIEISVSRGAPDVVYLVRVTELDG